MGLPVDSPANIAAAAQAMRDLGVGHVVVSLGKQGALLADADGVWWANSPTIEEKNPIGAGDSMVGGLVWGLSQEMALPQALRWGIACGAATASRSGTAVGTREMVETLLEQVTFKTLAVEN